MSGNDDRTPLLGRFTEGAGYRRRERGDLGFARHVLENKFTWDLYKPVLATSAVSLMIFHLPYSNHGTDILAAIIYIISLILFLLTLVGHIVRFLIAPGLFPDSWTHPSEGLAVCTFPAALGLLIANGATAGTKWGTHNHKALGVFYWIFVVITVLSSFAQPIASFSHTARERARGIGKDDTAALTVPLLPLLLAGPVSAVVLEHTKVVSHPHAAIAIIATGTVLHGTGLLLTLLSLSSLLTSLTTSGFPAMPHTPSLFTASLAPAIGSLGATTLAVQALRHFPAGHTAPGGAVQIVGGVAMYYIGLTLGLVFWGLATWWGVLAVVGAAGVMRECRTVGYKSWMVVAGHAVWVLASAALLDVLRHEKGHKGAAVVVEIIAVGTLVVWCIVGILGAAGVVTGRLLRD